MLDFLNFNLPDELFLFFWDSPWTEGLLPIKAIPIEPFFYGEADSELQLGLLKTKGNCSSVSPMHAWHFR